MKRNAPIWLTIAIALIAFAAGLLLDRHYLSKPILDGDRKVNAILNLIAREYMDTVDLDGLIELSIPEMLNNLDPHTSYLDTLSSRAVAREPNGVIPDIGIAFIVFNDTVHVESTIPGGPGDVAGILPGDQVVRVDGKAVDVNGNSPSQIFKPMTGPNGSRLTLGVLRHGSPKTLTFTITRNRIRENSIDVYYLLDKNTGYVKVNQFGRNTYNEFIEALTQLQDQGAKRFMIDLRGNGGGYVNMAVLMANEFLRTGERIVSTHGKNRQEYDQPFDSDGKGRFQDAEVAVLIDEYSASASEIFAGALQDNDRALIVGRRSYGKGIVQRDFKLPDSTVVRLAVARYYTPSGRCIQRDYKRQGKHRYENELLERYNHGELFYSDSVRIDRNLKYTTKNGRTVYGGGGIVPDIFVPRDLEGINGYLIEVENAGLLQRFAFTYCENNRASLNKMTDYKQFLRTTPIDNAILKEFADFAAAGGVAPRWYYINQSRDVILTRLKAMIARDIFGPLAYTSILNRNDEAVQTALKALNRHKAAFPITE